MIRKPSLFFPLLLLAGCGTGTDDASPVSIPLAETRLIGTYTLVDYLFEYGDGVRLDPSVLPVTGTLDIGADSSYLEGIRVGSDSTPTQGRITRVTVNGDKDMGELGLTLESADSASTGESGFSFRKDTLVLVTVVSKERDVSKKGFRETAYYLRDSK